MRVVDTIPMPRPHHRQVSYQEFEQLKERVELLEAMINEAESKKPARVKKQGD